LLRRHHIAATHGHKTRIAPPDSPVGAMFQAAGD
jgi:hypothetical protein